MKKLGKDDLRAFSGTVGEREWKPARNTMPGTLSEPNEPAFGERESWRQTAD